jgi:hypothetical protein
VHQQSVGVKFFVRNEGLRSAYGSLPIPNHMLASWSGSLAVDNSFSARALMYNRMTFHRLLVGGMVLATKASDFDYCHLNSGHTAVPHYVLRSNNASLLHVPYLSARPGVPRIWRSE